MGVEKLARALAEAAVNDRIYNGHYFGFPDPRNAAEMEQAIVRALPLVRAKAEEYAALVLEDD